MAGIDRGDSAPQGGGTTGSEIVGGTGVLGTAPSNLGVGAPGFFQVLTGQFQSQQSTELARRAADLQERQFEHQADMQRQDMELRREAQAMQFELQRLALDRADDNEKTEQARLDRVADAKIDFAKRGQTYAMWLAGLTTGALVVSGLVCVFLTVAGVISTSVGVPTAVILLAAGLFASIAGLVKHFLSRGPGGGESDDAEKKG